METEKNSNNRERSPAVLHHAKQALVLFAIWLLLSGHYDWVHLSYGVLSVALVLLMNWEAHPHFPEEYLHYHRVRTFKLLGYVPWLAKEMVFSALHVARMVLSPRMPINPSLVTFKSEQPNPLAMVILADSISLTPGTVTLDVDGEEFIVHALTDQTADSLASGSMQARVAAIFTRTPGRLVSDFKKSRSPRLSKL